MAKSEIELLQAIKNGQYEAIEKVYLQNRKKFVSWAQQRFNVNNQDLEDVWQETILIFFENVKNGRLLILKSKLSTYLFSIGKIILLNNHKKAKRTTYTEMFPEEEDVLMDDFEIKLNNEASVVTALELLGGECKKILISRFYMGNTIDNIKVELGMKNNNVVSASISRCLSRLKDIINANSNKDVRK